MTVIFSLYRFNYRRRDRGAPAAHIEVFEDGESVGLFWMNRSDLLNNIKDHGESEVLRDALKMYDLKEPQ